ncbi:MAG: hypothetical protein KAR62_01075 [Sphingomonadales bacterium]|nr:hypothetical protein [Sphingomonadales bacterium]
MTNTALLMEIDDMPMVGDATIGLLRYAAKKEKNRRFNHKVTKKSDLSLAQVS